jgi:hypothetical protein
MRVTRIFALTILTVGLAMAPAFGDSGKSGERPLTETLDDAIQGLFDQMKPTFEGLIETFKVLEEIDSIENYENPEILPNGDVIMRRREDTPPLPRDDDSDADEDQQTQPSVKI